MCRTHLDKRDKTIFVHKRNSLFYMDQNKALKKFHENPRKVLDNARRGVQQDLLDVVNFWNLAGPTMLSLGVIAVLFHHLDPTKTPARPTTQNASSLEAHHAWLALVGLTKLGNFFNDYINPELYDSEILAAWPGVFKWSAFFYSAYVEQKNDPARKQGAVDIISASWCSLCRSDRVRKAMVSTEGSVEIATKIWILEDEGVVKSVIDIPSGSAALSYLIQQDHPGSLDRIVRAAGGRAENVAKMAISRVRTAIKDPNRMHEPRTVVYLDLIIHMSRLPNHPLRYAFLNGNIIALCTNIAVTVAKLLNSGGHPGLIGVMADAFGYLTNCLESTDGFTWVIQSVKAGLLGAFVDCSPHFSKLDNDDQEMVLEIVKKILPKYLVYRSVIQAVDGTMSSLQLSEPPHHDRVIGSIAKDAWLSFHRLALERLLVTMQAKAMKGKAATCDNVKCQKIDSKNNFRKCAGCSTSLYCSKECQVVAWKEGGHKNMCIMKQRERLEGKYQSISKSDAAFFHHLAPRDARHELPNLRRLARKDFPETEKTGLIIYIDYTANPLKISLLSLANYEKSMPATSGSPNAEARNEALIERAKENPGKFTIIQSKIANGQGLQLVLGVVTGDFWGQDDKWGMGLEEGDDESDETLSKAIDSVDLAMGGMTINALLRAWGQPPAF